ncbi:MAG: VOC family protein [Rhodobacteraceae bacterium]|nr:VOC family protein [Paracoccaceae bacterium]
MTIERIEEICYGVENMDACEKFARDMGLDVVSIAPEKRVFCSAVNQLLTFHPLDFPDLPKGIEDGPSLRRLTWGVSSSDDLDRLGRALGPAATRRDNELNIVDPNGLALSFRVAQKLKTDAVFRPTNQYEDVDRLNERLTSYGAPRPMRFVHVALNITKENNDAALAFYTGPLRFKATDKILDTGTFLQSDGDIEHHNFFLCFRPDKAGINHFAAEVYDLDAVIEAGNSMIEAGWKESRKLGRHLIGSNSFRFVHAPFGGRVEFVADMDRMDKSWVTKVWDKNPGHHIWMLKSSGSDPSPQ